MKYTPPKPKVSEINKQQDNKVKQTAQQNVSQSLSPEVEKYMSLSGDKPKSSLTPTSYTPNPTTKDYEIGTIKRYFVKHYDVTKNEIIEISKRDYDNIGTPVGIDAAIYKPFIITWKISGEPKDILDDKSNIKVYGISDTNKRTVEQKNKEINIIWYFRDYLELSQPKAQLSQVQQNNTNNNSGTNIVNNTGTTPNATQSPNIIIVSSSAKPIVSQSIIHQHIYQTTINNKSNVAPDADYTVLTNRVNELQVIVYATSESAYACSSSQYDLSSSMFLFSQSFSTDTPQSQSLYILSSSYYILSQSFIDVSESLYEVSQSIEVNIIVSESLYDVSSSYYLLSQSFIDVSTSLYSVSSSLYIVSSSGYVISESFDERIIDVSESLYNLYDTVDVISSSNYEISSSNYIISNSFDSISSSVYDISGSNYTLSSSLYIVSSSGYTVSASLRVVSQSGYIVSGSLYNVSRSCFLLSSSVYTLSQSFDNRIIIVSSSGYIVSESLYTLSSSIDDYELVSASLYAVSSSVHDEELVSASLYNVSESLVIVSSSGYITSTSLYTLSSSIDDYELVSSSLYNVSSSNYIDSQSLYLVSESFYINSGSDFIVSESLYSVSESNYINSGSDYIVSSSFAILSASSNYAGFVTLGTVIDNGDGTMTLPTESIFLFQTGSFDGRAYKYTLDGGTTSSGSLPALVDGVNNYIVGDYNNGTPIFNVIQDVELINESTVLPYYTVYRRGTSLRWLSWDKMGIGLANKLHQRLVKTRRFERESGLMIGETSTPVERTIILTEGRAYNGINRTTMPAINTSSGSVMNLWYHSSSVWVVSSSINQYDNQYYDDGTDLVGLSNKYYRAAYYYRCKADNANIINYILGNIEYKSLLDAQNDKIPADLPSVIISNGMLVGRSITQLNATSSIFQSAFDQQFGTSNILYHNETLDLQGGDSVLEEYYHLNSASYASISTIPPNISESIYSLSSSLYNVSESNYINSGSDYIVSESLYTLSSSIDDYELVSSSLYNVSSSENILSQSVTSISTSLSSSIYDIDYAQYTNEPNGFVNRTDSTLLFESESLSLTISGSSYDIFIGGNKYTHTGSNSTVISDTTGMHYIYYDANNNFTSSVIWPGFNAVLTSFVYWNSGSRMGVPSDERHGIIMDSSTHAYLHSTVGTRYESGLTAGFTNTAFSTSLGVIWDEDNKFDINSQSVCDVFYKSGSSDWLWLENQTKYYYGTGNAAGLEGICYNNGNTLTRVNNNEYTAYWIFATNSLTRPIIALMGQYAGTLANVRLNSTFESLSLGNLPFKEMKLLYRVIVRQVATTIYIETQDLRSVSNLPAGTYVATDHATLTNIGTNTHAEIDAHILTSEATLTAVSLSLYDVSSSGYTVSQSLYTLSSSVDDYELVSSSLYTVSSSNYIDSQSSYIVSESFYINSGSDYVVSNSLLIVSESLYTVSSSDYTYSQSLYNVSSSHYIVSSSEFNTSSSLYIISESVDSRILSVSSSDYLDSQSLYIVSGNLYIVSAALAQLNQNYYLGIWYL